MQIVFTYPTGKRQEGVVLAATPTRLRVAVRTRNETMELRLIDGQWLSDEGDPIEFDAILADESDRMVRELTWPATPRLIAVGR
jgi:hypothetical protein